MALSKENRDIVIAKVSELGKELEGKLPPVPGKERRNSYAHIWKGIKEAFGKSYKDCDDEDMDAIMQLIKKISSC